MRRCRSPSQCDEPLRPSQPVTATPTFSPAQGTFTSDQMVTISDATGGAVIYYTTDGSDPYTGSPVYSAPIPINQTTVLKAFAIAPGDLPSFTATSLYTITSGGGGSVNYGLGFTSQGLALNGAASINGNALQLTDGNSGERASAWYTTKVNVQAFTQDFSILLTNARGDGMTFVIQNAGTTALGPRRAPVWDMVRSILEEPSESPTALQSSLICTTTWARAQTRPGYTQMEPRRLSLHLT